MDIRRLTVGDEGAVIAASQLFDGPACPDPTRRFLHEKGHHLLVAYEDSQGGFGNRFGVVLDGANVPETSQRQQIAASLGFSETVREEGSPGTVRARVFAPRYGVVEDEACGLASMHAGGMVASDGSRPVPS